LKKLSIILFAVFSLVCMKGYAEEIGAEVYPSEEELYEAYLDGQIDYETYLKLKDILQFGIDSTEFYLIEEIPNLDYFLQEEPSDYSGTEKEMLDPYLAEPVKAVPQELTGRVRWRRFQRLEEGGDFENRVSIDARYGPNWKIALNTREGYDGRRSVAGRSVTYTARSGKIRKFAAGSYTARFGLGLNVGYRGKTLDKETISVEETALYPDFGGYNGLYMEGGEKDHGARGMVHFDKDSTYSVQMAAFDLLRKFGDFRTEVTVLGTHFQNRPEQKELNHYQFGFFLQYEKRDFEVAIETTLPKGMGLFPAAVLESKYVMPHNTLKLTAWYYGDEYTNYFGGARSGAIYQTYEIEDIGLELRDRRRDQRGILIKTSSNLNERLGFDLGLTVYGQSEFNNTFEMLSGLGYKLNQTSRLKFYYEYDRKKKGTAIETDYQIRGEYRLKKDRLSLRTYLGYREGDSDCDYLSFFARAGYDTERAGMIEAWLNLSRLNLGTGEIDYLYGYLKEGFAVTEYMELAGKIMYRYSRSYTDREELTLMLETNLLW